MSTTDLVAVLALAVSIGNLIWTIRQKREDGATENRKKFTDIMLELSNVSVRFEEILAFDKDRQLIGLRRILNSRRRVLVLQAEKLIPKLSDSVSDIEFQLLAIAFDNSGDQSKARNYWAKCVDASNSDAQKLFNLRGFARYLYRIGQPSAGREKYAEATRVELTASEDSKHQKADTYLLWARTEFDFGYTDEGRRLLAIAATEIDTIAFLPARTELAGRLKSEFPEASA